MNNLKLKNYNYEFGLILKIVDMIYRINSWN